MTNDEYKDRFVHDLKQEILKAINEDSKNDLVNHPAHYCSGAHECIDVIKGMLSPQEFLGFLKGNIFKYRFRAALQNGDQDIKKAEWYETRLLKELEILDK